MVSAPLQQEVRNALGLAIAGHTVPAGEILTLDGICAKYGVSRSVARAAVGALEAIGMVAARRSVGVTVRPMSDWNVLSPRIIHWRLNGPDRNRQMQSLTALRLGIEPIAAYAAAGHMGGDDAARLQKTAASMRELGEAGKRDAFIELDAQFHELILLNSGNELYAALADPVIAAIRGRSDVGLMPDHPVPEAIQLHLTVASAIQARQGAQSESAMRDILSEVNNVMRTLPRDTPL